MNNVRAIAAAGAAMRRYWLWGRVSVTLSAAAAAIVLAYATVHHHH